MDELSVQKQSGPGDVVYPSKRDAWLVMILWVVVLISAAGAIYTFTLSLSIISTIVQEVIWIGIAVFCVSILRSTYYTLTADSLLVRTGPFRWTILFEDIDEVVPSRKAWSSASLSMDRLYISHKGSMGGTYISPEGKGAFLQELADRAPGLRVEGDTVVRVETVTASQE